MQAVSDTGAGSTLQEFQDLKCTQNSFGWGRWDGMLSITTTGMDDCEIYHYKLNVKETISSKRLTKLPSSAKNNAKFSGTEASLFTAEDMDLLLTEMTCFLQKMLILQMNNIAVELVAEVGDCTRSGHETVVLASGPTSLSSPVATTIENLMSGLEEYLHKHRNHLTGVCESCFSCRENLKVGKGVACKEDCTNGLVAEAVIMIGELSGLTSPSCLSMCEEKTEVLYFKDFCPFAGNHSTLNALRSINWKSYGLALKSITDDDCSFILDWVTLPPNNYVSIAIHCYNKPVIMPISRQRAQLERKLIKKSVKLALNNLKENYTGTLLSAHALKISSYAPDLARSVAGLIFSSNDHEFQEECFSLLGLQSDSVVPKVIENCIKEKIVLAIEIDDRKPSRCQNAAPSLFQDEACASDYHLHEYEDGEGGCDLMDC
ncbi:hypothetical protein Dimus_015098 [Dionaea muscipula]